MTTQSVIAALPENQPGLVPSNLKFPVVGLGASAGGLQALLTFFEHMPADSGMAFVVILHLSPKHDSIADDVLQRVTAMPVIQVKEKVAIEADHIYVIAPNLQMSMSDGELWVGPMERPRGPHISIDIFFRTLADAHKSRAIAVVLSGTGSDGSVGLARIKEQGGIALAQAPEDAEYNGMPAAAMKTGVVDFVLRVADMPQQLIDLWQKSRLIQLPPLGDGDGGIGLPAKITHERQHEDALQRVISLLGQATGHDFRHYKRATILRRIERRLQVKGLTTMPEYVELLEKEPEEFSALLKDMLIGVTNFFRDREAFDAVERDVLPLIFKQKTLEKRSASG